VTDISNGLAPSQPTAHILVVDDLEANRALIARLLAPDGYLVSGAADGAQALRIVATQQPDLVLLDVMMPGADGFAVCRAIKQEAATRLIPVILITSLSESSSRIEGLDAGADDYVSKPVNAQELRARVRSLLRIKRYTDDLDSAESVILSLALTIEARDAYTDGHCQRLAQYGVALGRAIGCVQEDLDALQRGGFLHDIGKVGIPDAVLLKPERLTLEEYEVIKQHTVIGDRLCGGLRSLKRVRPIIRSHHERLDGTGYPDGLGGNAIPLLAQVIGIVDVFDALTTERPYKRALSIDEAAHELAVEVAHGWRSAELVDVFVSVVFANRAGSLGA
jgi:putative two-component system response regulator